MQKKEDRRTKMTKRMLKDALIEMLREKDIYRISVRELCEKADVNRTTFYKYYGSQFDLLIDMENDMLDFISKAIKHNETNQEKIIVAVCRYLEDNIQFARLIINNNVDPAFAHKLFSLDTIKESTQKRITGSRSEAEFEYIYNFLTYGTFSTICVWLNKEERETPEAFAKLINQMMVNR
ncbi:MAG: TetR/AcrR family transcriptional regulator [Lachnospiraceae bacterium]|jgi:AcrR family transcriptional regulator